MAGSLHEPALPHHEALRPIPTHHDASRHITTRHVHHASRITTKEEAPLLRARDGAVGGGRKEAFLMKFYVIQAIFVPFLSQRGYLATADPKALAGAYQTPFRCTTDSGRVPERPS